MAFTRIDDEPIDLRYQIYNPDYVLVLDDGLLNVVDVFSGIKDNTEVIINTEDFEGSGEHIVHSIDATGIALDLLGRNIVNTIILGYFAKKTIKETFPGKIGELNAEATKKAYEMG